MSIITENIIPGSQGRIFSTDATSEKDLEKIAKVLSEIKGVKDVIINREIFPKEFTIRAYSVVNLKDVQDAVNQVGFHAIPKGLFELLF